MSTLWEVLAARAAGLSGRLLTIEALEAVDGAPTVSDLSRVLAGTAYGRHAPPRESRADVLDTAIARTFADHVATLSRWCEPGGGPLAVVFLEQDVHSVRSIVRGLAGSLSVEQRLGDAVPTPSLSRRALELLAHCGSAAEVASTLTAWGHPVGSALLEEATRSRPDLFRMEAALARRLSAFVGEEGVTGLLARHVQESLDASNARVALLITGARTESEPSAYFVEGGHGLTLDAFVRAASASDRMRAAEVLSRALRQSIFARALADSPPSLGTLSERLLDARIDRLATEARRDPLGVAPVLLFLLRLRREAAFVRRALWRARFGARAAP